MTDMESGRRNETERLVEELNVLERFAIADQWISAAKAVAQKSENSAALEIAEFLETRTALGVSMPELSIHTFFRGKPTEPVERYAFVTPLVAADLERLPKDDFRYSIASGASMNVAEYREGSRAIYLPNLPFSEFGKGVLLLHETVHARNDIDGLLERGGDHHWLEEADVFAFEFDIMRSIGGSEYLELLRILVDAIEENGEPTSMLRGKEEFRDAEISVIRQVFDITNEWELGMWIGVARMNAFYDYLVASKKDARSELASYLKNYSSLTKELS